MKKIINMMVLMLICFSGLAQISKVDEHVIVSFKDSINCPVTVIKEKTGYSIVYSNYFYLGSGIHYTMRIENPKMLKQTFSLIKKMYSTGDKSAYSIRVASNHTLSVKKVNDDIFIIDNGKKRTSFRVGIETADQILDAL